MGLNQALGLDRLQTRRKSGWGSGLHGLLAVMMMISQTLRLRGVPPGPGLSPISSCKRAAPALSCDPAGIGRGSVEPGWCPRARLCPPVPPTRGVSTEGSEWFLRRNICNMSLGFLQDPAVQGSSLPSATSLRRVLWIYFCIYKYNVRMARSITNNIHDTAVNGARCEVWLPGALAHAGR